MSNVYAGLYLTSGVHFDITTNLHHGAFKMQSIKSGDISQCVPPPLNFSALAPSHLGSAPAQFVLAPLSRPTPENLADTNFSEIVNNSLTQHNGVGTMQ